MSITKRNVLVFVVVFLAYLVTKWLLLHFGFAWAGWM